MVSSESETLEGKKQVEEEKQDADVEEVNQTAEDENEGNRTADDEQESEEEEEKIEEMKKRVGKVKKVKKQEVGEVTPTLMRPTRERKTVERYSETSASRSPKPLSIPKGQGTQLKDIPNVAFKMSKRKPDDNLQQLHSILFGKKAKAHMLKKNLGLFSGFVWAEDEQEKQRAKLKEKLDKCVKEKLFNFCDILNVPINKATRKKEELSTKLLEFLESPHATTDTLLADKEKKDKKRKGKASASKSTNSGDRAAEKPAKKRKQKSQVGEKRKQSFNVEEEDEEAEPSVSKDGSQEDDDNDVTAKTHSDEDENDSESDSEEEQKPPRKKQKTAEKSSAKKLARTDSPVKSQSKSKAAEKGSRGKSPKSSSRTSKVSSSSASEKGTFEAENTTKSRASSAKKHKVEKEQDRGQSASGKKKASSKDESSKSSGKAKGKDQGKGKSGKKDVAEPTGEEMHAVVAALLKEVDFDKATLSDILRQLGAHFDMDLMHRKAEVKAIITDVINNMTDEEDEEEDTEAGDDPGNDDDDDEADDDDA